MHYEESFPARFGPFVLLRRLGSGGMGSAYLARHADVKGLLVVKRLHPELVRDETIFKRFVHEAEVAAHVRHLNVAAVVAMGTVDGEPFLATEYVFGMPAAEVVQRVQDEISDPLPLGVALGFGVELVRGLEAIHEAVHRETGEPLGLIHRDIGARNVLVGFDGHLRIIDLGLGKSALSDWQTAHQVLAGSPDYMPPEQAMGARVDGRADVYAAAVTIWELLVGHKRIRSESVAGRLELAVAAQPEPLLDRRPDASARLEAILKQAMAPDPDRRTPTASILRKTLEEERKNLGLKAGPEAVVAWLDGACATIIAKERRLLEEARALEERALRPVRAQTRFFVQETGTLAEDPYAAYEAPLDPEPPPVGSPTAAKLAAMVDPERLAAAPAGAKVTVAAAVIGFMALVAGITAWVMTPEPPVHAVGLPPPPPPPVVPPPPPAPPIEEVVAELAADAGAEDAEAEVAPSPSPRTTTRRTSKAVLRRKRGLVERLRTLRRQRFEIAFQRKLTRLSTRLSKARTEDALDDIEASLRRLEAE